MKVSQPQGLVGQLLAFFHPAPYRHSSGRLTEQARAQQGLQGGYRQISLRCAGRRVHTLHPSCLAKEEEPPALSTVDLGALDVTAEAPSSPLRSRSLSLTLVKEATLPLSETMTE